MKINKRYDLDSKGRIKNLYDVVIYTESELLMYPELAEDPVQQLPIIEWDFELYPFKSCYYKINNGKIIEEGFDEEVLEEDLRRNNVRRIKKLKMFLEETDWKVIVNAELFQAGLPLKYPNLHEERQAWRDEINELEA